jgi:hypothetical protein
MIGLQTDRPCRDLKPSRAIYNLRINKTALIENIFEPRSGDLFVDNHITLFFSHVVATCWICYIITGRSHGACYLKGYDWTTNRSSLPGLETKIKKPLQTFAKASVCNVRRGF